MAEHGLAQQGGRFNILYAEHRTEKTNSGEVGGDTEVHLVIYRAFQILD
jgi:hypothetical protein